VWLPTAVHVPFAVMGVLLLLQLVSVHSVRVPAHEPASNVQPHAVQPRVSAIAEPMACWVGNALGHVCAPACAMHVVNGAGFGKHTSPTPHAPVGAPASYAHVRPWCA